MTSAVNMAGSTPDSDAMYPDSGMRILGVVQINIGILVFVLGVVDLILTMTSHDSDLKSYGSHYETVVTMTTVSSPLWSGIWFSVAGALAACFAYGRPETVLYIRVALIVTSLLCCALFGPACAVINGFIAYRRRSLAKEDFQWLISLIVCFLAIIEVIMATVTASITCCCATFRSTQVHIFVNPRKLNSSGSDASIVTKLSTVSEKSDKNLSRVAVSNFGRSNTSTRINLISPRHSRDTPVVIPRELKDGWTQVTQVGTRTANVGTSVNNFVHKFNQTPVKDTNNLPQQSTIPMITDKLQLLPQTITPVTIADEGGSVPHPRQSPVQSLDDDNPSQQSNRSSAQEIIMRTPRQWINRTPDTNLSIASPGQRVKEVSVKTVQSDPLPHQSNSTPTTEARESAVTERMTWTPDRHLRNQPPPLPPRPASNIEMLHDTSYQVLKKLALPH